MVFSFIILINLISLLYTCCNKNKKENININGKKNILSETKRSLYQSKYLPQRKNTKHANKYISANGKESYFNSKNNKSLKENNCYGFNKEAQQHPFSIVDNVGDVKLKRMDKQKNLPVSQQNNQNVSQNYNTFNKLVAVPKSVFL
uniref:Uncharacterized protein n=1 Tax=Strongyloides stercoralis TaxID=6248 RepID=A0A0K0EA20_STRER